MDFFTVKNWNEFQHYAKRNPPWIKMHRAILDDYAFCKLSDADKGRLMLLWLYASQNNGEIPNDVDHLQKKLSVDNLDLGVFVSAGFLIPKIVASKVRAVC